ncbi:MAG: signal peptidase I, partial [Bacteroidales bacterium]|nr:signal peptidase I [Bacteroidales bacterium]
MWYKMIDILAHYLFRGLLFVVACLAIHYSIHIFVADQFIIPSSSMYPTLMAGDRVIVVKTI